MSKLNSRSVLFGTVAALFAQPAAAEGIPHTIDYYSMILHSLHLGEQWIPTVGALFVTAALLIVGVAYKAAVAKADAQDVPSGKFSLRFVVEMLMDLPWSVARDNCGHFARNYFPFLAALFLFILFGNLSGMIPGFPPPTVSMDTNVAMGVLVFFVYNYAGIKEHGASYIKHFLGPVVFIAPLFFCIEIVSHAARPLSLGLRLAGNIFADHTLLGVATGLSYVVIPAGLMFFGLLVAVVQSFVFTLLSGIYISMATSHDH